MFLVLVVEERGSCRAEHAALQPVSGPRPQAFQSASGARIDQSARRTCRKTFGLGFSWRRFVPGVFSDCGRVPVAGRSVAAAHPFRWPATSDAATSQFDHFPLCKCLIAAWRLQSVGGVHLIASSWAAVTLELDGCRRQGAQCTPSNCARAPFIIDSRQFPQANETERKEKESWKKSRAIALGRPSRRISGAAPPRDRSTQSACQIF